MFVLSQKVRRTLFMDEKHEENISYACEANPSQDSLTNKSLANSAFF